MIVVDRGLAEAVDVEYTDRRVTIVKELIVEDKPLNEKVLVIDFSENVKECLKNLGVGDSMTLGMTILENV